MRETFLRFITRPTGFGRTSWPMFIILVLTVGLMARYALFGDTDEPASRWVSGGFALAIAIVVARGTWRNFKGKQG